MAEDGSYYIRRAAEERARAARARSEETRRLHLELAALLEARAVGEAEPGRRP